jgi:hypothetical protein
MERGPSSSRGGKPSTGIRASLTGRLGSRSRREYAAARHGARRQAPHPNLLTPFHEVMYGLMSLGALLLTGTTLLLAREVARHGDPALDPTYRLSIVVGLLLTFPLGATAGAYMAA